MTTELLAELESLRQQVATDTMRFKEIQEHGAKVETQLSALRKVALAAKHYSDTGNGLVALDDCLDELNQQFPEWEKETKQ